MMMNQENAADADRWVYVASLSDYNAGRLHGVYICDDVLNDIDDINEEIQAMLEASPEPGAEEYAIHETNGFGDAIDEYTSLETVAEINQFLDEYPDFGQAILNDLVSGGDMDYARKIAGEYCGTYDSFTEYAHEVAHDIYEIPDNFYYVDYAAMGRDLKIEMNYADAPGGQIHIFNAC